MKRREVAMMKTLLVWEDYCSHGTAAPVPLLAAGLSASAT